MMTGNPYLDRIAKRGIGGTGRASEQRLARELRGRARPASGARAGAKGDIDLGTVLMEAKCTAGLSMSLKRDWLLKIAAEARAEQKTAALSVSFVTPDGRPLMDGEWVCVPRHVWESNLK
jgi:hypothetical protein